MDWMMVSDRKPSSVIGLVNFLSLHGATGWVKLNKFNHLTISELLRSTVDSTE